MGLKETLDLLNKKFGEGTIVSGAEAPSVFKVPSSVPVFNYVSFGGIPIRRIVEFLGPQSSLKSYCAYDYLAIFQHTDWANNVVEAFTGFEYELKGTFPEIKKAKVRKGYLPENKPQAKKVALIDLEGTYTKEWGKKFGIDNKGLIRVQPDRLSQAADITESLLADEDISLVVLDSMSIIGADDEMDKSMEDHQMGSGARFWNKAVRKFQAAINRNPNKIVTLILINSTYDKIGFVMGDPMVIKNGKQLGLSKSLSVLFTRKKELLGEFDGKKEIALGVNVHIKCLKNKVGQPFRQSTFFYSYVKTDVTEANTPDIFNQLIELGVTYELITRSGAWYSFEGVKVSGMEKFIIAMHDAKKFPLLEDQVNQELNKY